MLIENTLKPFEIVWLIFIILYFGSIAMVIGYVIKKGIYKEISLKYRLPLLFYSFMYGFCIVTMIYLNLFRTIEFYFILNIIYGISICGFLIIIMR